MKYRGKQCQARPFSDETGEGVEHFIPADKAAGSAEFVASREHVIRIVSDEERAANDAAARSVADAQKAADEREAVYRLQHATIQPAALAAKVAELKAEREAKLAQPIKAEP